MMAPEELEAAAEAYLRKREESSGAEFPLSGVQRVLCRKVMAAFACECVIKELQILVGD